MKINRDYKKNLERINSVVEIRLSPETWNKIKWVAIFRNRSYSWVVRYAVFRTIKRKHPSSFLAGSGSEEMYDKLMNCSNSANLNRFGSEKKHRHKLCLYGEDEFYLRMIAARMNWTMTHLVRISLEYQLNKMLLETSATGGFGLPKRRFSRSAWYWLGIKTFQGVEFHNKNKNQPSISFIKYPKDKYW